MGIFLTENNLVIQQFANAEKTDRIADHEFIPKYRVTRQPRRCLKTERRYRHIPDKQQSPDLYRQVDENALNCFGQWCRVT